MMLKLLRYASYIARNPLPSAILLILSPLVSLSICTFLLIDKIIYDRMIATFDDFLLAKVVSALLISTFFLIGLNLAFNLCLSVLTARVSMQIKEDLTAKLLTYDYGFFLTRDSGYIVKRLVEDTDLIAEGIVKAYSSIGHLLNIAASGLVYYFLGWGVFSLYCLTASAQIVWSMVMKVPIEKSSDDTGMGYSRMYDFFWEALPGIREIKLQGIQGYVMERLHKLDSEIGSFLLRNTVYNTLLWALITPLSFGFFLIVMLAGLKKVQEGQTSTGVFVLVLGLVQVTLDPLRQFMESIGGMHRARSAVKRIESLKGDFGEPSGTVSFREFSDRMLLKEIALHFESGRKALDGIDLEIPKTSYVAIVGETGSGKSTIAHVLVKLFRNYTGEVTIDGQGLASLETASLRDRISLVTQEIFLFRRSIRENIDPRGVLTDLRLREICRVVQLEEFLDNLPQGLDTQIGDEGIDFSGGERQRISIARCLAKESDVIILDEATSALDPRTQEKLMAGLTAYLAGRTIISITHNVKMAEQADRIFVMEDGRLAEFGSHSELISKKGAYHRLFYSKNHQVKGEGLGS